MTKDFDILQSLKGQLSIKAIRLSENFLNLVKKNFKLKSDKSEINKAAIISDGLPPVLSQEIMTISQDLINEQKLTHADIFDVLPIKIKNASLTELVLQQQLKEALLSNYDLSEQFFESSGMDFVNRQLERLNESIDPLLSDQHKYKFFLKSKMQQKTKSTGAAAQEEPSRLDTLLYWDQVTHFCSELQKTAALTDKKTKVLDAFFSKQK